MNEVGSADEYESEERFKIKHCVRPVDTKERRVAIILRRICEDGPVLEPLTNGESLRNFDKKLHKKVQKRCEKMLASKILPYERSFHLVEVKRETEKCKIPVRILAFIHFILQLKLCQKRR